jgi:glucose-1-phosphate thymidylyltransferase
MIPIAKKPILEYVIEALAQNGVRNILLVVGYKKEQVQDYFGSGAGFEVEIEYIVQPQQLGTAHALKQARDAAQDKFLVLSGDNIIEPDALTPLLSAEPNAILIKRQENVTKYGVITLENGVVKNITEKPREATSHLVNTGIYAFSREIFEFIHEEVDLPPAIQNMISQGLEIKACETKYAWLDALYPWDILKLNDKALAEIVPSIGGTIEEGVIIKPPVSIGKNSLIRGNSYIVGPAVIGENCEIGPSVCILPTTTIGDNVSALPFTEVRNSVIANSVEIGPGSSIHDSIIDRGCNIGGHFVCRSGKAEIKIDGEYHEVEVGGMVGEHCSINEGVIVQPGVIIGTSSQINSLKVIERDIPEGSLVV